MRYATEKEAIAAGVELLSRWTAKIRLMQNLTLSPIVPSYLDDKQFTRGKYKSNKMKTAKHSKASKAAARTAKEQASIAAHIAKQASAAKVIASTNPPANNPVELAKDAAKPEVKAKRTHKEAAKVKAPAAERDALGGLVGTFASRINLLLIKAGKSGLTLREAVVASNASIPQPCNSQLKNLVLRKLVTRVENAEGKFCYTVV
jgi:hypothetical protein